MCYLRDAVLSVADWNDWWYTIFKSRNTIHIKSNNDKVDSHLHELCYSKADYILTIGFSAQGNMLVRTHLDSNTFHLCYQKQRMSKMLERIIRQGGNKVHSLQVVQERLLSLFPGRQSLRPSPLICSPSLPTCIYLAPSQHSLIEHKAGSIDVLNNSKKRDVVRWVDCSLNTRGSSCCGWRCHHLFLMKSHPGDKMAYTAEDGRNAVANLLRWCQTSAFWLNKDMFIKSSQFKGY